MPLKIISKNDADAFFFNNRLSRWDSRHDDSCQNADLACNRLNNEMLFRYGGHSNRSLIIDKDDSMFAIGSCFAREIESHFLQHGHIVSSVPTTFEDSNTSTNFLNRYNLQSMLLEFQRCLEPDFQLHSDFLILETCQGLYRDYHYNAAFPPIGMEACFRRREYIKSIFRKIINSRIVVITLGLNEVWYDRKSGVYLNTRSSVDDPLPSDGRLDPEFQITNVSENLSSLVQIYNLIKKHIKHSVKLIITVSPVPLVATFSGDDIVLANSRSKAILRATAEEFCAIYPEVVYFPSYEIALNSNPGIVYESDRRHVTKSIAHHIVSTFRWLYMAEKGNEMDTINFTSEGKQSEFIVHGWSTPEEFGTWSMGNVAILEFGIPPTDNSSLLCEFEVLPYLVAGKHDHNTVIVKANGLAVSQWEFGITQASWQTKSIALQPETVATGRLVISFHIKSPKSPKALGQSEDSRDLGFAIKNLRFSLEMEKNNVKETKITSISADSELMYFDQDGKSDKASYTFYRGTNSNFHPTDDSIDENDMVFKYFLKTLVPNTPLFDADTPIVTFGSCFAGHIAKHLDTIGYNAIAKQHPTSYVVKMGEGIVNSYAIRQQFEWAWEGKEPSIDLWHGYDAKKLGYDENVRIETKQMFDSAEVFIITLGLSEVWYDEPTGEVFMRAVPIDCFDPSRHKFRTTTHAENFNNLKVIYSLIRLHRPDSRIIFTLSPIPLKATFREIPCTAADCVSKAVLRAALDEFMREQSDDRSLFYFPSYEMVLKLFQQPFMEDRRHVHKHVLDLNMAIFERYFCKTDLTDYDVLRQFRVAQELDQKVIHAGHWAVPRINLLFHASPGSK